jgi:hypothetical protein
MSRWNEQSKSHAFQASWAALKASLEQAELAEDSSSEEFKELARLKKVITYLGVVLDATDPEFIPLGKWDEFNPQVAACSNEVLSFVASRNIGHLHNANSYADALLSAIKPFVVASGKSARALSDAAKDYSDTLAKFFDIYKREAKEALTSVREARDEGVADARTSSLAMADVIADRTAIRGEEGKGGILKELKEHLAAIENSHEKIAELYDDLLVGSEEEDSKKSKFEAAVVTIEEEAEKTKTLVTRTAEIVKGLETFYEKSFGAAEEDGSRKGGYSADLIDLKTRLLEFEKQQKTKYDALNQQIESLLPGATSAGLASAYREMKESFVKPIRFASGAFYVAIGVLVVGSILMAVDSISWSEGIKFNELGDWESVLRSLAYKLPFYGPAVWFAYYASKRRSEYQRLQQEYAHKEALAKSYDSYKKQIQELGHESDEMLVSLLNKAIDAIAHNASQTLDGKHGDKMPLQEAVDRIAEMVAKKSTA